MSYAKHFKEHRRLGVPSNSIYTFTVGTGGAYKTLQAAATARAALGLVSAAVFSSVTFKHTSAYGSRLMVLHDAATYPHTTDLSSREGQVIAYAFTSASTTYMLGYLFWDQGYETWCILSEVPAPAELKSVSINIHDPIYAAIELQPGYFQEVTSPQSLGDLSFTTIWCPKWSAGLKYTDPGSNTVLSISGTGVVIDGLIIEWTPGSGELNGNSAFPLSITALAAQQSIIIRNVKLRGGYADGIYALAAEGKIVVDNCDIICGYDGIRVGTPQELLVSHSSIYGYQRPGTGQTTEISAIAIGASTANLGKRCRINIINNTLGGMLDSYSYAPLEASDISFAATAETITTAGSVDFTDLELVAGDFVRVRTTSGTNDGWYTVASVTSTVITCSDSTFVTENAATAGTVRVYDATMEVLSSTDNPCHVIDARTYLTNDTVITIDGNYFDIIWDKNGGRATSEKVDAIYVENRSGTSEAGAKIYVTGNRLSHVVSADKANTACKFINNLDTGQVTVYEAYNTQVNGAAVSANVGDTAITYIT